MPLTRCTTAIVGGCEACRPIIVEPAIGSTHRNAALPLAERRLIQDWVVKARKHGQSPHQVVAWVRRKVGPSICTWRFLASGELGSAVPCVLCCRELQRFGFRVVCSQGAGEWFRGHLGSEGAPRCKLTVNQELRMQGLKRTGSFEQQQQQQL